MITIKNPEQVTFQGKLTILKDVPEYQVARIIEKELLSKIVFNSIVDENRAKPAAKTSIPKVLYGFKLTCF